MQQVITFSIKVTPYAHGLLKSLPFKFPKAAGLNQYLVQRTVDTRYLNVTVVTPITSISKTHARTSELRHARPFCSTCRVIKNDDSRTSIEVRA